MKGAAPTTIDVGKNLLLEVPLLRRVWSLWDGEKPAKTNGKPVIRPVLQVDGGATFAELAVAAALSDEGAIWWCWIDTFNQRAYRR